MNIISLTITKNKIPVVDVRLKKITVISHKEIDLVSEILSIILLRGQTLKKYTGEICFQAEIEMGDIFLVKGSKKRGETEFKFTAERKDTGVICTKEYYLRIPKGTEPDAVLSFRKILKKDYPNRICTYRDVEKYYKENDFFKKTDGLGTTRHFRAFMSEYIGRFEPERLDGYMLDLLPSGSFVMKDSVSMKLVTVNQKENLLFHFLCYLHICDFWNRAEKIRSINSVVKPIVVTDVPENINMKQYFENKWHQIIILKGL